MKFTVISVPRMNDSFSRIVLDNKVWEIRFTYNHPTDCWKFGLFDTERNPVIQDIKIVPGIPINHSFWKRPYPNVLFAVKTKLDRVGHEDFWNGNAEFFYAEMEK